MSSVDIGARIRKLRKFYRISVDCLAERLNISPAHLRLIEKGQRNTGIQGYIEISNLFHVSLDYLLAGRGEETKKVIKEADNNLHAFISEYEMSCLENFIEAYSRYNFTEEQSKLIFDVFYRNMASLQKLKKCGI